MRTPVETPGADLFKRPPVAKPVPEQLVTFDEVQVRDAVPPEMIEVGVAVRSTVGVAPSVGRVGSHEAAFPAFPSVWHADSSQSIKLLPLLSMPSLHW